MLNLQKQNDELATRYAELNEKETVFQQLLEAYTFKIPVIIKGPSGSGKRFLVSSLEKKVDQKSFRTDGNDSLNTSRLLGWFDPVTTLKKG